MQIFEFEENLKKIVCRVGNVQASLCSNKTSYKIMSLDGSSDYI